MYKKISIMLLLMGLIACIVIFPVLATFDDDDSGIIRVYCDTIDEVLEKLNNGIITIDQLETVSNEYAIAPFHTPGRCSNLLGHRWVVDHWVLDGRIEHATNCEPFCWQPILAIAMCTRTHCEEWQWGGRSRLIVHCR